MSEPKAERGAGELDSTPAMSVKRAAAFAVIALAGASSGAAACSSGTSAPSADAGPDVIADVHGGGLDVSQPFPTADSAPAADAGSPCDQERQQVLALQLAAEACNPQSATPCNGAVDGICCPITVSTNTGQAVDDFTQAVLSYKSKCTPDCSTIRCGQAPSNVCLGSGSGTKGTCQ